MPTLGERAAARRAPRRGAARPLGVREREDDARVPEARRRRRAAGAAAAGDRRSSSCRARRRAAPGARAVRPATACSRRRCDGHDLGLISEAGLPAVADPGARLVAGRARGRRARSSPCPAPSSLLLALAASGLNGQSFAFVGYLPVERRGARARIRELEALSRRSGQTQLMIETPYRNAALLGGAARAAAADDAAVGQLSA